MANILGIDIGATKICAIVFKNGKQFGEITIITPNNLSAFKKALLGLIKQTIKKHLISAIGIGMAGLVDQKKGIVLSSPNMKFIKNFKLADFINKEIKLPVKIDNDASCFVRAEYILGQAKRYKNVVGLTLGTGIGGGFIIDGKLYRGSGNLGGEAGAMFLDDDKSWESLFQTLRKKRDYQGIAAVISKGTYNLIKLFEPECIVLGGSVVLNAHQKFLPQAQKRIKNFPFLQRKPKILITKLKNASALGAALLFKNE